MRSLLSFAIVLVTVFVASSSWTGGFRRLNRAEWEELNEICGKTLTWQYPRRSVQRISHGTAAIQGELPWAARLIIPSGTNMSFCSASIISKYHIITAAHCIIKNNVAPGVTTGNFKKSFMLVGSSCAYWNSSEQETCEDNAHEQPRRVHISKIIVPESSLIHKWQLPLLFHDEELCSPDIAIVELENPISDMNDQMVPICVPSYITSLPVEYTQYGFGDTGINHPDYRGHLLRSAQLYKLRQNIFQRRNYFKYDTTYSETLCEKMVAVQHSERSLQTCHGDSGGGLSGTSGEKHYLFGVLRGGNDESCGLSTELNDVYSLYTDLIPYNDFLCFYTGVCPLGYDMYMDGNYAWHPEAVLLYSGGNFFTWLNKDYLGIYMRTEAPEDFEKGHGSDRIKKRILPAQ